MKYLYLLLLPAIFSCTSRTNESANPAAASETKTEQTGFDQNNYETFADLKNYLADGEPPVDDLFTIDSTCAIIIDPSQDQITKMENEMGEDFVTVADDNGYYQSEAFQLLDSANIKTVFAEKPFLRLKGKSDTWTLDIRKEGAPAWNVILFHPNKKPVVVSAIDVTYEKVKEYFGN